MATQPTAVPGREGIQANVDRLSRLYAAVVADCCDEAGYRQQILAHTVRPLKPGPHEALPRLLVARRRMAFRRDAYQRAGHLDQLVRVRIHPGVNRTIH